MIIVIVPVTVLCTILLNDYMLKLCCCWCIGIFTSFAGWTTNAKTHFSLSIRSPKKKYYFHSCPSWFCFLLTKLADKDFLMNVDDGSWSSLCNLDIYLFFGIMYRKQLLLSPSAMSSLYFPEKAFENNNISTTHCIIKANKPWDLSHPNNNLLYQLFSCST